MKLFSLFFLFLFIIQSNKSFGEKIDDDAEFVKIIKHEFDNFKKSSTAFNVHLNNVIFTDQSNSHVVTGDDNIYLNLTELKKGVTFQDEFFKSFFMKLVLSHEIGHKIQALGFGSNPNVLAVAKQSVFLECDADMLAGIVMQNEIFSVDAVEMTAKNSQFDIRNYLLKEEQNLAIIFFAVERMDKRNLTIATHPFHDQRTLAFYEGKVVGNAYFYWTTAAQQKPASINFSIQDYDFEKKLSFNAGRGIGYNPNGNQSNPIYWAHEESIAILNENRSITRNLVRYNTHDTRHNNGNNSSWDYSFIVYNGNSTTVEFKGCVYTRICYKHFGEYVFELHPLDVIDFDEKIAPGQSVSISGSLYFKDGPNIFPEIVFPGDWLSKYYAFTANNATADNSDINAFEFDFREWTNSTLNNITDQINYILARRNHLFQVAKGLGISKAQNLTDLESVNRYYAPSFNTSNEDDQTIVYTKDVNKIRYIFNAVSSADSGTVKKHFTEICQMVNGTYSYKAGKLNQDGDKQWVNFFDSTDKKIMQVTYMDDRNDDNRFIVEIRIFGNP